MATSWESLKGMVEAGSSDYYKFMQGNNAAGTRVRKSLMDIKKYCDQMRKDIQDERNSRAEK